MYSLLHLPDYAAGLCIPKIASVYTVILIYSDQKKKGEFQKEALPKSKAYMEADPGYTMTRLEIRFLFSSGLTSPTIRPRLLLKWEYHTFYT